MKSLRTICFISIIGLLVSACGKSDPISPERFEPVDRLAETIAKNISEAGLEEIVDIDHARLGSVAGSPMPPSRVLIFSAPELEAELLALNPLIAIDLPMRVLTYESAEDGSAKYIFNNFDYLVSRYQLDASATSALRASYDEVMKTATQGLPDAAMASFDSDVMQPDGIITISSPFDFDETVARINAAIDSQDDTMHFGVVDFQATASEQGVESPPALMILFGGPGPGGKAMAEAPTLGLDGFCQKFLVWQDAEGKTHLSFNDLIALAERQQVSKAIALRVINFRLNKVFEDALAEEG